MKNNFTSAILVTLILLLNSLLVFPQKAESNHPQPTGSNNKYKNSQIYNSTKSNPSDITENKNINRTKNQKNIIDKKNKRDYKNITKSENYFHIDKSGKTLWDGKHWDLEEFPLKVYVKESLSRIYNSRYEDYISYAFDVWQKADNRIKFIYTNNSRESDIQFIFVEDLGRKYEENYLGLTEYDVNRKNEIESSKIQISLIKFSDELIPAGEIKATIIHELGHAFGLGHSENETDIMYPYISPDHTSKMTYDELSLGDKEAIKDVIDLCTDKYVWK